MKKVLMCLVAVLATACARGPHGDAGAPGAPAPIPAPPTVTPLEADVAALLADENDYRQGLGQTELTAGLSCQLFTFTSGDRIQASIAGHNTLTPLASVGTFLLTKPMNQPDSSASTGLNILPAALQPLYLNLYMVRCQGQIVIQDTDYQLFDLASDDGSILYVDGAKVIDNDNNHGVLNVSGMKYLRRGVHTFRVDFAQSGGGNQALILKMNGSVIDPILWAH